MVNGVAAFPAADAVANADSDSQDSATLTSSMQNASDMASSTGGSASPTIAAHYGATLLDNSSGTMVSNRNPQEEPHNQKAETAETARREATTAVAPSSTREMILERVRLAYNMVQMTAEMRGFDIGDETNDTGPAAVDVEDLYQLGIDLYELLTGRSYDAASTKEEAVDEALEAEEDAVQNDSDAKTAEEQDIRSSKRGRRVASLFSLGDLGFPEQLRNLVSALLSMGDPGTSFNHIGKYSSFEGVCDDLRAMIGCPDMYFLRLCRPFCSKVGFSGGQNLWQRGRVDGIDDGLR